MSRMSIGSCCDFHTKVNACITTATPAALHVTEKATAYTAAIELLSFIVNRERAFVSTVTLAEADDTRDRGSGVIAQVVNAYLTSPVADKRAAAILLNAKMSPYRGIRKHEYTKQTAETRGMLAMLDDAANVLPWRNESWGHVTKGMALMLKLKFLMMNKDFENAEPVARELYAQEGSVYSLLDDYASVFMKSNARNSEIIHAIPAGESNPNYWITQTAWSDIPGYEGENWATFLMQWDFYDSFEDGDKRKETIVAEYTSSKTGAVVKRGAGNLQYGCCPIKIGPDPDRTGSRGTTDIIVFRYADVLLSLAECINENNGGPTAEAIELVDRVRGRVGLGGLTSDKTADKVAFNAAILNERLHEFYCEGLSRSDKIRHGTFVTDSQNEYPDSQSDWYKVRFPIPTSNINESQGVVKQNDGY